MPQGLAIATVDVSFPLLAPDGSAAAPSYSFAAQTGTGIYRIGGALMSSVAGVWDGGFSNDLGSFMVRNDWSIGWSSGHQTTPDLTLYRDAANVLAQRNGANAQTLRIYATYTDAGNYERLSIGYNAGLYQILTSGLGTGVTRPIQIGYSGTKLFQQDGTDATLFGQNLVFSGDNTYDIGASGATRPRAIYSGTSITTPLLYLSDTSSQIYESLGINLANVDASRRMFFTNGARTTANPGFTFQETWNDAGVAFVGKDTNITATLSAAGSLVERWRVGGTQIAALRSDGVMMANYLGLASGVTFRGYIQATADGVFAMLSGSGAALTSLSWGTDATLTRLAAASMQQGGAPSATPVAQTFTIGEASRPGTDLNIAGSNGTIRSGLGTGNAAGSSLLFLTPTAVGSSTVAQTYGQRLSLSALGATFDIPDQSFRINGQVSGAGASLGTLTNAPSAGPPNFWLPFNVNGTVYMFPGW